MWQRIQTIFLLVSALASLAYLFVPIATVDELAIYGKEDVISTAIAIGIALLSIFIISQFKDRKLQIRFCRISVLLAVSLAATSVFAAMQNSGTPNYAFAVGVPILIIIALLLAYRNIKKDEDLVKSMDRFR